MVWCGVVLCGLVWCGVVWCGVVWCGVVWCGVVWCTVVWCDAVWCGVVWCGVVWCGVVKAVTLLIHYLLFIFSISSPSHLCHLYHVFISSSFLPASSFFFPYFDFFIFTRQTIDGELYEHMKQHGDYTHFYFSYRWFLLDFKRGVYLWL